MRVGFAAQTAAGSQISLNAMSSSAGCEAPSCALCSSALLNATQRTLLHSKKTCHVLRTLCAVAAELFTDSGGDAIFPHGSYLCRACVRAVEKVINLRKSLEDAEKTIIEGISQAGEAKGLSAGLAQPGKHD